MFKDCCNFNEPFLPWMMMLHPRAKDNLTKTLISDMRHSLLSHLSELSKKSQKCKVYCCCPWLPTEKLKVSPYFRRYYTPQKHSPWASELEVTWKATFWGPAFMAPEGIMCDSKGRRQTIVPHSYDSCKPHQPLAWHNNSKGTIVTCITWQWTTAL